MKIFKTFLALLSVSFLSVFTLFLLGGSNHAMAMGEDDPLLTKFMIDKLEVRDGESPRSENSPVAWDVEAYLGKDLHKVWFNSEGEYKDSETEDHELRLFYSSALSAYWDGVIGWRYNETYESRKSWLLLGVQGVAPYFIETEASFFIGENQQTGLRLEMEKELMLTQRWVLIPELEMDIYSKDDFENDIRSGISDFEVSARLAYTVRREFMPYVGVSWEKVYSHQHEDQDHARLLVGVKAWF